MSNYSLSYHSMSQVHELEVILQVAHLPFLWSFCLFLWPDLICLSLYHLARPEQLVFPIHVFPDLTEIEAYIETQIQTR